MGVEWICVPGVVVQGNRVASMSSAEYPYPTLEKQKPYFKKLGLDLDQFFTGTLNISIAPLTFEMHAPSYTFQLVAWTDLHPPETFSFSPCQVSFKNADHAGWVYHPHAETKMRNFQNASLVEVITGFIPGITYGAKIILKIDPQQIQVR
jgi:hypothetical protein